MVAGPPEVVQVKTGSLDWESTDIPRTTMSPIILYKKYKIYGTKNLIATG